MEDDIDVKNINSNTFKMEWLPKSGKEQEFPEVDKAAWFAIDKIGNRLPAGQEVFLVPLAQKLDL